MQSGFFGGEGGFGGWVGGGGGGGGEVSPLRNYFSPWHFILHHKYTRDNFGGSGVNLHQIRFFFFFFSRATDQQYGIRTFEDNSKLHGHTNEHGAHQEINRSLLPCRHTDNDIYTSA